MDRLTPELKQELENVANKFNKNLYELIYDIFRYQEEENTKEDIRMRIQERSQWNEKLKKVDIDDANLIQQMCDSWGYYYDSDRSYWENIDAAINDIMEVNKDDEIEE